jgi:hypothetical protein
MQSHQVATDYSGWHRWTNVNVQRTGTGSVMCYACETENQFVKSTGAE